MNTDKAQIIDVLRAYEAGCNTNDAAAISALYAEDAILFPDRMAECRGKEAVSAFYHYAFDQLALKLDFAITPEEVIVSGTMAVATTTSVGIRHIKATGESLDEINRELWTFQKVNGDWKIGRYCFNKAA